MNDLISRQAAIDEIEGGAELIRRVLDNMDVVIDGRGKFAYGLGLLESCIEELSELPSAQPEIIKCNDCKWFDISEPSGTVEPIGHKCKRKRIFVDSDDFCKRGERREE